MEYYIGVKQVKAEPAERDGKHGYRVVYPDGYESWSPADVFESAYMRQGADPTRVNQEMVEDYFTPKLTKRMGNHTVVFAQGPAGFSVVTDSACVDPENYDEAIGAELAGKKAENRAWELLGFVLSWARHGIRHPDQLREGRG